MMNPIVRREIQTSFRNRKTYIGIGIFVSLLAVGGFLMLYASMFQSWNGGRGFDQSNMVGFYCLLSILLIALALITVPAMTAGSISGERERQTLDLLLVSKMTPKAMVLGKFLSSMGMLLLLVFLSLPVFSLLFYFGSISIGQLFLMVVFTVSCVMAVGAMGLYFSCLFKKTVVSMVLVYFVLGLITIGSLLLCLFFQVVDHNGTRSLIYLLILLPNPIAGFTALFTEQTGNDMALVMALIGNNAPSWMIFVGKHYWLIQIGTNSLATIFFVSSSIRYFQTPRELAK